LPDGRGKVAGVVQQRVDIASQRSVESALEAFALRIAHRQPAEIVRDEVAHGKGVVEKAIAWPAVTFTKVMSWTESIR